MSSIIEPHGGKLVDLYASTSELSSLTNTSHSLASWDLTHRQLCDIELILNGGFSPLNGFLSEVDYHSVVEHLRLSDQTLWPIPITLDIDSNFADAVSIDDKIALRDPEGVLIAIMHISDKWQPDKNKEAQSVFGSTDEAHSAVNYLINETGSIYLGGKLTGITPPTHYDYAALRHTPTQLRAQFLSAGWKKIIAFHTQEPMHRAQHALTLRAIQQTGANLLLHPVSGMREKCGIDYYSRVRCYQHILTHYPKNTTELSLLPLATRMTGPRETVWHAIIRQNFGCTHFIVEHDYASLGKDTCSNTQALFDKHQSELHIQIMPFEMLLYVESKTEYQAINEVADKEKTLTLSHKDFHHRLKEGLDIPSWFSYPEVIKELRKTHPSIQNRGFTVFFTGLSGSGKSTIANALLIKFYELGRMRVTLLDGDIVRKKLSSELGFSKAHRHLNVERIGYVASEITKNGGIAICAPIAPYAKTRSIVREMVSAYGGFIEVHVSTSLEVCEKRDRKGLYAKARRGDIKEFTGISDPYEIPEKPELIIDTTSISVEEATHEVFLKLASLGYIK